MKAKRPKPRSKARPKPTSVPMVSNPSHGNGLTPTFLSSLPYHAAIILLAVVWYYRPARRAGGNHCCAVPDLEVADAALSDRCLHLCQFPVRLHLRPDRRPWLLLSPSMVVVMRTLFALALVMLMSAQQAGAATSCQTRKSGSVTITTCSTSTMTTTCRSYMSGSVVKTSCL